MAAHWLERECDVLVIGAGAAGLRAAIAAAGQGARVAVACKSLLGKAATVLERAVPAADEELEGWGALPLATRGEKVGLETLRTLQHRAVSLGIEVHMECAIQRLFASRGRVAGALGVRRADGALVRFRAGAVVLAAGGAARLWQRDIAAADATGDAFALALDAGAELADMDLETGGVRVDPATGATTVPGLHSAGDAAAGKHALLEVLLLARRAGEHAAAYARSHPRALLSVERIERAVTELLRPFGMENRESPYALLLDLQDCMQNREGLAGLKQRAKRLAAAGPRAWNPAWLLALELRSLLVAAEATMSAAVQREASLETRRA